MVALLDAAICNTAFEVWGLRVSGGFADSSGCCRLELRSRLLETLRPFAFPGVASLSQEILADVAQRFPDDPQAWDLRARAAWDPIGQPPAHSGLDGQQRLQVSCLA